MPNHFHQLSDLFSTMDHAWDKISAQYQFQCQGCKDNCCFSLFYHHTHVEKAYLLHGFNTLVPEDQKEILTQAKSYCKSTFFKDENTCKKAPESQKIPCPLLLDGKCRLYKFRPMICRMHGLPHEIHKPGVPVIKGPGCSAGQFDTKPYVPFDRTPFYRQMAKVEMDYRYATGKTQKIKLTIAQMLVNEETRH
ncbi:MAG: hypothetical protein HUK40_10975 [Desulfobacter sp.]|nr:hypothetical protein [Desulfobacter sp.]WDP84590.1 MAG: hypothetical protein HUN05_05045 [Desulfobacter sp.]